MNKGDRDNERHDNIDCGDDDSVEETEMRSNKYYVTNNYDNLAIVFDKSTCSGESVCNIFEI